MAEEEAGSESEPKPKGGKLGFLTEKKGGMPLYVWLAGGGVLVAGVLYYLKTRGTAATAATGTTTLAPNPFALGPSNVSGGGGSGGGTAAPISTPPSPATGNGLPANWPAGTPAIDWASMLASIGTNPSDPAGQASFVLVNGQWVPYTGQTAQDTFSDGVWTRAGGSVATGGAPTMHAAPLPQPVGPAGPVTGIASSQTAGGGMAAVQYSGPPIVPPSGYYLPALRGG